MGFSDEDELLRQESLPPSEEENIVDDDFADFRKLTPEEQKWALIQMEIDREAKSLDPFLNSDW